MRCVWELQRGWGVPGQDPLLDFDSEVKFVYRDPAPAPPLWTTTPLPTHAIDTTSRVISFVLGFALASLIAWLGSISGDEVAATGNGELVASVGTPVVTAAIQEKKPVTKAEPQAPVSRPVAASGTAPAPPTPAPAIATRTATPTTRAAASGPPAALSKTAEPAAASSGATPSPTPRPSASGYRGALALSSNPEGAQVVLNGKLVGQTPVVLNDLPVGSRALVVRREGYSPWSASVRVVAGQRTTVRATLRPSPQSGG